MEEGGLRGNGGAEASDCGEVADNPITIEGMPPRITQSGQPQPKELNDPDSESGLIHTDKRPSPIRVHLRPSAVPLLLRQNLVGDARFFVTVVRIRKIWDV